MTVRLYQSTDASAPVLTGQVGSLTALLDAVLVNGYGSKTAAGWTIAFTGTNKRVYTMAAGGTGFSLYVDDTGPGAGGAREARLTGFEAPTGLGTGTGQFPTSGQIAIGIGALVCRKSNTADATARAWTVVADGHTVYLFTETGDRVAPVASYPVMFGDFFSYSPSDLWNCAIIGRTNENTPESGFNGNSQGNMWDAFAQVNGTSTVPLSQALSGHFVARNFNGVGGSVNFGKHSDPFKKAQNGSMQMGRTGGWANGDQTIWNGFNYPNPCGGGLFFSPLWVQHSGLLRGYLKGLWDPCHLLPLNHNDAFSGTGPMTGKSLLCQQITAIGGGNGYFWDRAQCVIETSDTWS